MARRFQSSQSTPMRRYTGARGSLLVMLLLTVINVVLAAVGSATYFLVADYAAYMAMLFGYEFYYMSGDQLFVVVGAVAAALVMLPYFICWLVSKKRPGALWVAFALFAIDTVLVVALAISGEMILEMLMDVGIHIFVLVELFLGARSGKAARAELDRPAEPETTAFYDATVQDQPDSRCLGQPQEERKYRVLVETTWGSRTVQVRRSYGLTELVIDGRLYGVWEGMKEQSYRIVARVDGHEVATTFTPMGKQTIEVDGEVIAKKQRLY